MILKEYRILLPLTVEEYRIAQQYMIAVSPYTLLPIHVHVLTTLNVAAEEESTGLEGRGQRC